MVLIHPSGSLWTRFGHWLEKHLSAWEGQNKCAFEHCPYHRYGRCYLWGDGSCSVHPEFFEREPAEEVERDEDELTETISEDGATVVLSE